MSQCYDNDPTVESLHATIAGMDSAIEALREAGEAMARAIESGHVRCDGGGCDWTDRAQDAVRAWRKVAGR